MYAAEHRALSVHLRAHLTTGHLVRWSVQFNCASAPREEDPPKCQAIRFLKDSYSVTVIFKINIVMMGIQVKVNCIKAEMGK